MGSVSLTGNISVFFSLLLITGIVQTIPKTMINLIVLSAILAFAHANSDMIICKMLQGEKKCVDMGEIFHFLDDDGSGGICQRELDALTQTGDSNGDGLVTSTEFEKVWMEIGVEFGVEPEKHAKYFSLIDGIDGTEDDGVIRPIEHVALLKAFDEDESNDVSPIEFLQLIKKYVTDTIES